MEENLNERNCSICSEPVDGNIKDLKRALQNGKAIHYKCQKQYTKEFWREYFNEKSCSACGEPFVDEKVRDHCHLSGKYRGAAHKTCNLILKKLKKL